MKGNTSYKKLQNHVKNWLDNSNFLNPVNQRQLNSGDGAIMIDRWYCYNVTLNNQGITMSTSNNSYILQVIPNEIINILMGKYVTLACSIDGQIRCITRILSNNMNDWENGLGIQINAKGMYEMCYSAANGGLGTLAWMALYEGEYNLDTLPYYESKEYATELAECQRYFQLIKHNWQLGYYDKGYGSIQVEIPIAPMRQVPSIVYTHSGNAIYNATTGWIQWESLGAPSISYYIKDMTYVTIVIPYTNDSLDKSPFLINNLRALSADL